jgi:hypothetical protein
MLTMHEELAQKLAELKQRVAGHAHAIRKANLRYGGQ